jgi:Coenzyme PQQ synthesis protein D (PqqD)
MNLVLQNPDKGGRGLLTDQTDQLFTRSRTVVSRVVSGETLIVPIRAKVGDLPGIYRFNGTGSLIWQLLESPQTAAKLAEAVVREYTVEQEQAQRDVAEFVSEMFSVGLVEHAQAPAMIAKPQAEWQVAGSR